MDHAVARYNAAHGVRVRRDALTILVHAHIHLVNELVHGEVEALRQVLLRVLLFMCHRCLGQLSLQLHFLEFLLVKCLDLAGSPLGDTFLLLLAFLELLGLHIFLHVLLPLHMDEHVTVLTETLKVEVSAQQLSRALHFG